MKVINTIIKILVALAAIAGAVYVAATYGDKIVAWCKKVVGCKCCCEAAPETVEEIPVEEEAPAEDAVPAEEEAPAEETAVVDSDFEN